MLSSLETTFVLREASKSSKEEKREMAARKLELRKDGGTEEDCGHGWLCVFYLSLSLVDP